MSRTTSRGYGWQHQQIRRRWAPYVEAGSITCWRCQQRILPGSAWDLGHDDNDRSIYKGPEHANQCNRRAAGAKSPTQSRTRPTERHPGLR